MHEVTKEQFKEMYFRYGNSANGWTPEYWQRFYEEEGPVRMKYMLQEPESARHTSMMIVVDCEAHECRMLFLTEQGMEDFFDYPGKE